MTEERVRALVVEDEPEARRMLREFLREASWVDLVGEAADGSFPDSKFLRRSATSPRSSSPRRTIGMRSRPSSWGRSTTW